MKIIKATHLLDHNPVLPPCTSREREQTKIRKLQPGLSLLSNDERRRGLDYWQRYARLEDPIWFDFYFQRTGVFDERFVPHDLFYAEIDRVLNNLHRAFGVDDKMLYSRLFPNVRQPRNLCMKTGGCYWTSIGQSAKEEEIVALLEKSGPVILKYPVLYCGGNGVRILDAAHEKGETLDIIRRSHEFIVQELICQHASTAVFHPQSVNTMRIITYLRENGEAVVLSAVLRMGNGGSRIDNVSSGGCSCGIWPDGTLKRRGFSSDGWPLEEHPSSHVIFAGHRIDAYPPSAQIASDLHKTLPQFGLIAWDFAADQNNLPVLIEVNIGNASIDFMQLNNGPLFGQWTDEVLERVYRKELKE